jgi:hypothetical protein
MGLLLLLNTTSFPFLTLKTKTEKGLKLGDSAERKSESVQSVSKRKCQQLKYKNEKN